MTPIKIRLVNKMLCFSLSLSFLLKYISRDKNIVFLMSMFLLFTNYLLRLLPLCHVNVASRNGKHFPQKSVQARYIVCCNILIIASNVKLHCIGFNSVTRHASAILLDSLSSETVTRRGNVRRRSEDENRENYEGTNSDDKKLRVAEKNFRNKSDISNSVERFLSRCAELGTE